MLVIVTVAHWAVGDLFAQRASELPTRGLGYVRVRSAEDVVQSWSSEQHVYVKGELGVGSSQLTELQRWLSENGPHWTVVLMQQAADEVFVGHDGRRYTGLDAVEYALGYGLSNRSTFGNLEHAKTKETDGAVFALFLQERKFSYFGSDAQDRRKLGEANWVGELDQPAFQAMRAGGRIVDAVKNTVKAINTRLERAIQAEVDAAERAKRELERAATELRASLANTRQLVDQVSAEAASFHQRFPEAKGPLSAPPMDDWRETIDTIDNAISSETVRELEQRHSMVADEITKFLNEFAAVTGLKQHAEELEHRLVSLRSVQSLEVQSQLDKVNAIVANAEQAIRDGSAVVAELLAQADAAALSAENLAAVERRRTELAELRSRWIRITIAIMLGILGVGCTVLLWILNRRRRPVMLRAQNELAIREASVRSETDNLDTLFGRCTDLLGSTERVEQRGYVGATRKVAMSALGYIDDLLILSKEVKRVVEEARHLAYPLNPLARITNLFSSGRYQQAINHLTGKPLRFSRASGLPAIVREMAATRNKQPGSTGSAIDHPDEIMLTFEEAYASFKQRGDEAEQALREFEESLAGIHDVLRNLQAGLEELTQEEARLQQAAKLDGHLAVPSYFDVLIPSVQADLANADQLAAFDAIQAMRDVVPTAQRKIAEAKQLGLCLSQVRTELFPVLRNCADGLNALGFNADWIDSQLESLTATADHLLKEAAHVSIRDKTELLAADLQAVGSRAENSLQLAKHIRSELQQQLHALGTRVLKARGEMSARLKLVAESVLIESNRNPDDYCRRAKENLDAAETLLKHGRFEAASESIETCKTELTRAGEIIDATQSTIESYDQRKQSLDQSLERLEARTPQIMAEVQRIRTQYAATALIVDRGNRDDENAIPAQSTSSMSVTYFVDEANDAVSQARAALKSADQQFRIGRVLESADRLNACDRGLAQSHSLLEQVAQHLARIENQNRENRAANQRCESGLQILQSKARDPLVREQTIVAIEQVVSAVEQTKQQLDTANHATDPFSTAEAIAVVSKRLDELQSQIVSDAQAHAEAARALTGAQKQLEVARQFVRQSQTDSIADSPLTTDLNNRIASLQEELMAVQGELDTPHGDWRMVDERASRLQSDLSSAAKTLSMELNAAGQALTAFQEAAKSVYQAEQWSGSWGIRVAGSPGVAELERARSSLQMGKYAAVLELSRLATSAALLAIQQAEREIARRRMEEQLATERARRAREASMRPPTVNVPFGGGFSGGFRGGFGGSSSPSRPSGGSSTSGENSSGFGRSGW